MAGSATAELSVLVPFLLVGVLGIVDFARVAYQAIAISNAAHAGAKYGAHSPYTINDTVGIQTAVASELQDTLDPQNVVVDVDQYCKCPNGEEVDCEDGLCGMSADTRRTYVKVRVENMFQALFPYPGVPETLLVAREAHVRAR